MKRKKTERTTLRSLILRAFVVVVILSIFFAVCFQLYIKISVEKQCNAQLNDNLNRMQLNIYQDVANDPESGLQELRAKFALLEVYDIILKDPFGTVAFGRRVPGLQCYSALISPDNTIVASNRRAFQLTLRLSDDAERSEFFLCDDEILQNPEITEMFQKFDELTEKKDDHNVSGNFHSMYINRDTHMFIPHKGTLEAGSTQDYSGNDNSSLLDSYPVEITIQDPAYELIELNPRSEGAPWGHNLYLGESVKNIAEIKGLYPDLFTYTMDNSPDLPNTHNKSLFHQEKIIDINNVSYHLKLAVLFDFKNPCLTKYYWKYVILFISLASFIALLLIWRKNILNKTKYSFEDYQRDLTDHLVHDIATPMTAISGYTENILSGNLSKEDQEQYLHSILDNISYADSLIERTLLLNHSEEQNHLHKETILPERIIENHIKKYERLLQDKHVTYCINGSAPIMTDRTTFDTIIENLISNAVKYVTDGGSINICLEPGHLRISNTVSNKINVKKLTEAFYRGDEARSNVSGNGLGLAIAKRSANALGIKLSLSCNDSEFHAELRF